MHFVPSQLVILRHWLCTVCYWDSFIVDMFCGVVERFMGSDVASCGCVLFYCNLPRKEMENDSYRWRWLSITACELRHFQLDSSNCRQNNTTGWTSLNAIILISNVTRWTSFFICASVLIVLNYVLLLLVI